MFEIIVAIGVCVVMAKIASEDDLPGAMWFLITFLLCVASVAIPLPFIRVLIAGVVSFSVMIVYKMRADG